MRIELELELDDHPGALMKALEPIAQSGGNIHNIFHNREESNKKTLPVKITLDVDGEESLSGMERGLRENKIKIRRIGRITKKYGTDMILLGHAIDTDIRDTLDRINSRETTVTQLDVKMADPKQPSSAYLQIESENMGHHQKALERLKAIAKEKKLQIIEPV